MNTTFNPSPDLPLWAARRGDPDTSHAAAAQLGGVRAEHQRLILEALAVGPGTADEIGRRCGLLAHAVGKRLGEMERAGLIAYTGETRPGSSGRMQRVARKT